MAYKRILYLAGLALCAVFHWFYFGWFSWFLLVMVLALPWLSLIVSLPAMLSLRLKATCARAATVGEPLRAELNAICRLPAPMCRAKLHMRHTLLGMDCRRKLDAPLPTEHCGKITVTPVKARVFDYLGLFRLPVRKTDGCCILVRPKRVPLDNPPDLSRYLETAFRPKPGGGFSENHELRLYRPGDNLHQIHWKLSAKTGKLIFREAQEALRGRAVVSMELTGTPDALDRKLGTLLWVCEYLLAREVPHTMCCLTGSGQISFPVETVDDAADMIDRLLACLPAARDVKMPQIDAAWHYHVGGDADA